MKCENLFLENEKKYFIMSSDQYFNQTAKH